MWDLIKAGGWAMVPIILVSIVALAICIERLWALRRSKIVPSDLLLQVWNWIRNQQLDAAHLKTIRSSSP